jgi:hypothetical protein
MAKEPWAKDKQLIKTISLPLNLESNAAHPFYSHLSRMRASAKEIARTKSVVA